MTANMRIMELADKYYKVKYVIDGAHLGHHIVNEINQTREDMAKRLEYETAKLPERFLLIYHIYKELGGENILIYIKEQNLALLTGTM